MRFCDFYVMPGGGTGSRKTAGRCPEPQDGGKRRSPELNSFPRAGFGGLKRFRQAPPAGRCPEPQDGGKRRSPILTCFLRAGFDRPKGFRQAPPAGFYPIASSYWGMPSEGSPGATGKPLGGWHGSLYWELPPTGALQLFLCLPGSARVNFFGRKSLVQGIRMEECFQCLKVRSLRERPTEIPKESPEGGRATFRGISGRPPNLRHTPI